MLLQVQRRKSLGGATIGVLTHQGKAICYTLEDEVRERAGEPVSAWKVQNATAIPAGTYRVVLQASPRFGADTLTLLDVEGFDYIRMHGGNKHQDTEGCLLLGLKVTDTTIVGGTSQPALALVKKLVKAAIADGEEVFIEISNAEG